jgi:hypothetical protein
MSKKPNPILEDMSDAAISMRWTLRSSLAWGPPENIGGATDQSVVELEELVEMLVLGWVDRQTGEHEYFERGSREERAALYAAAYLVDNSVAKPLSHSIRGLLADLLNPGSINARSLTLGFRRKPDARLKHRRIAADMRRMVRASKNRRGAVDDAVDEAATKYNLDARQVRKIWARYGKPMMN